MDYTMSSRKFGHTVTLISGGKENHTNTTAMSSSRIPVAPSTGYISSTSSRSQLPKPSAAFSRSRRGSSASESEDLSRLRMTKTNSSSKIPSREPSPSVRSSKSRPSPPPSSRMSLFSRSTPTTSSKMPLPAQTAQSQTTSTSWKLGKPSQPEGHPRNVLRRKAPSIEQYAERNKGRAQDSSAAKFELKTHHAQVQKIPKPDSPDLRVTPSINQPQVRQQRTPPVLSSQSATDLGRTAAEPHPRIPKELMGLSTTLNTQNLPPPTPNFTGGSSPSTRYSGSPGIWSNTSRTSTPTTISSYSPGIVQPTHIGSRLKQPSPTISRAQRFHQHPGGASSVDNSKELEDSIISRMPPRSQTEPIPQLAATSLGEKESSRQTTPLHTFKTPPPPQLSSTGSPLAAQGFRGRKISDVPRAGEPQLDSKRQNLPPLNTEVPIASDLLPSRPSRNGTENLKLESSPIIQSNLSTSRLPTHRRRGSSETNKKTKSNNYPTSHVNASTESVQSRSSTRVPYPSPSPRPSKSRSESRSRTATPINPAPLERKRSVLVKDPKDSKDNQKTRANASGQKRFGMFSKKSKSSPEVNQAESGGKNTRRCPTAGTGHEGYGKYSQRGRRTSVGSSSSRARSISTNGSTGNSSVASNRTGQDIDDFLLDRLEPVVISGGRVDGGKISRTQSEQSASVASVASSIKSGIYPHTGKYGGYSSESLLSTGNLVQSPESIGSLPRRSPLNSRNRQNAPPTVQKRRSFRDSRLFGSQESNQSLSVAEPDSSVRRPSCDKCDRCETPITQKEPKKKKLEKLGRWNFFQRSNQTHRRETPPKQHSGTRARADTPVASSTLPLQRPVAHYALVDYDRTDTDSLEYVLQKAYEANEETEENESPPIEDTQENQSPQGRKKKHGHSVLLPSPPLGLGDYSSDKPPQSPKVFFNKNSEPEPRDSNHQEVRPSRLTSVGRIPQVVPRIRTPHQPPLHSFSRPFSTGEGPSLTATADGSSAATHNHQRFTHSPNHEVSLSQRLDNTTTIPTPQNLQNLTSNQLSQQEFLSFPPRKGSEASASGSSESGKNLTTITAVVPAPGSKLSADEVWDEYDEFIDKVASPSMADDESSNSPQLSFRMAAEASKALQEGMDGIGNRALPLNVSESSERTVALSPALSQPDSVHLRRSMIQSALQSSSIAPSTPASLNESVSGAAERNQTSVNSTVYENPSSLQEAHAQRTRTEDSFGEKGEERDGATKPIEKAEQDRHAPMMQANLRSGSLMTSRWLSFGRVLFSPAHNHVQSQDQARILVIDGLGNDDWSFYCALTYPKATVYSLSTLHSDSASKNPAAWDPPPNHRTIHHSATEGPFPFPKGFFTVATVRFPSVCSEVGLRNVISECKRVLRTGGYLELGVMDLDMVNMGSRTRKAVRLLKERIFTTDPSICLKPASDNIQRLIGKRGFDNLNRCTVVVPVAGTIVQSSDTSSSNQSIALSQRANHATIPQQPSKSSTGRSHRRPPSYDANVFLGDLISDPSPSESNDESISKMVARIARWWHTRCYEMPVFPDQNLDNSIWADRRVLRECRRRGTGFKLLIAYTQKPSEVNRRTASV